MSSTQFKQECGLDCWLKAVFDGSSTSIAIDDYPIDDEHSPSDGDDMMKAVESLYQPLAPEQIRLLMIYPGASADAVKCELRRATITMRDGARLDEPENERIMVQYDALSYSWGWPAFTCSISCNGVKFPVTKHLKDALIHLRSTDEIRYLWTDAFCIHQTDLREKGRQVQLMFTIFRKARQIVGWIGRATEGYRDILGYLHCYSTMDHYNNGSLDSLLSWSSSNQNISHDKVCIDIVTRVQASAANLIDDVSWFHRTWIRQEVLAARSITMICGKFSFQLQHLAVLAGPDVSQTFRILHGSAKHKVHLYSTSDLWLHAVFQNTEGFEASLGQDRIFALQNVAQPDVSEDKRLFPVIDYTIDYDALCSNFTKRILRESRCLSVITVFEDRSDFLQRSLPSWATDYRVSKPRLVEYDRYERLLGYEPKPLIHIRADLPDAEQNVLRLPGFVMGQIGEPSELPISDESSLSVSTFGWDKRRHSLQARRGNSGNAIFYATTRNDHRILFQHSDIAFPSDRAARWKAVHTIINEFGYECRHWHIEDAAYLAVDKPGMPNMYEPAPSTIETRIIVTKIAEEGDIVVCLPTARPSVSPAQDPPRMVYAFLLRPSTSSRDKYHFLGPCIVLRKYKFELVITRSDSPGLRQQDEIDYKNSTGYTWEDHLFTRSDAWNDRLNQDLDEFALI